ncbi:MAG: alpha-glucan family phosphorylase, partial [Saprospiraceae bacterium]|nr:alpha-glucan family phosphorylase [Saprospiraceae bacterium]
MNRPFKHPYPIARPYSKGVAYFCMEFAIDQSLKIYSGGLGYLAGSHLRSAHDLRQNFVGIGMRWKYGYYDQVRQSDQTMSVLFQEKIYNFLEDTGIVLDVDVNRHNVRVKVFYLPPEVFGTAPLFLLSTDIPENDYLARTITHRLYDSNVATKIAQYIVLGVGGVKLIKELGWDAGIYHFNEAHALPGAYELLREHGDVEAVRDKLVFTTHTPIPAGNEVHDLSMLHHMSFFGDRTLDEVKELAVVENGSFNQTLNALHLARLANGVSRMHGEVARNMWSFHDDICP